MLSLREHISKYKDLKEAEKKLPRIKIHMSHFEEAMRKIWPLSAQELDMYKRIAERFGRPSAPTRDSAATTYSNAVA